MQTLRFTTNINAPREKVWHVMLDDAPYREWTAVFNEGSYFRGDWQTGSKMLFLGPDEGADEESGLVSRIAENRPNEYLSIEHIGLYARGEEDLTSEEARKWTPAFENYTYIDKDGSTELQIEMDVKPEFAPMFEKTWPEALKKIKEIAERA